jgi:hypothetical protein
VARAENVTVLFTDLVGSTQLSSGVAPQAADEIRWSHSPLLRQPSPSPTAPR